MTADRGWVRFPGGSKFHLYTADSRSLCGRYVAFMTPDDAFSPSRPEFDMDDIGPEDCLSCWKKLVARPRITWEGENGISITGRLYALQSEIDDPRTGRRYYSPMVDDQSPDRYMRDVPSKFQSDKDTGTKGQAKKWAERYDRHLAKNARELEDKA